MEEFLQTFNSLSAHEQMIISNIIREYQSACKKHTQWPTSVTHPHRIDGDITYAAAIVAEETGELIRAAIQYHHEGATNPREMVNEAVQVGAMALRFLVNVIPDTQQ